MKKPTKETMNNIINNFGELNVALNHISVCTHTMKSRIAIENNIEIMRENFYELTNITEMQTKIIKELLTDIRDGAEFIIKTGRLER